MEQVQKTEQVELKHRSIKQWSDILSGKRSSIWLFGEFKINELRTLWFIFGRGRKIEKLISSCISLIVKTCILMK